MPNLRPLTKTASHGAKKRWITPSGDCQAFEIKGFWPKTADIPYPSLPSSEQSASNGIAQEETETGTQGKKARARKKNG
jgi:hypothetical protein